MRSSMQIQSLLSFPDSSDAHENSAKPPCPAHPNHCADESFVPPLDATTIHTNPNTPLKGQSPNPEKPPVEVPGGGMKGRTEEETMPLNENPLEGKKPSQMRSQLRSSIACLSCRKSKIKCENTGINSVCNNCKKTGQNCVFEPPKANLYSFKRPRPPSDEHDRNYGPERRKFKSLNSTFKPDCENANAYAEETLSALFLTQSLWEQALNLYKLHFAAELPFLHLPSIKEMLDRKFKSPQQHYSPNFNFVLLGVLTLTARFLPDLEKYITCLSNKQLSGPTVASEYYAGILATALGPPQTAFKTASVERVQAALMLGMYEWSQMRHDAGGLGAWMWVGNAIRLAQYLKLGSSDHYNCSHSRGLKDRRASHQSQVVLENETKRRTMFSCFVLDCMLAFGKERVPAIRRDDLRIQLPCSENQFDLAMEVQTGYLADREQRRSGTDDNILSWFIRQVDVWTMISQYCSQGGWLTETHPPWNERSTFFKLNKQLQELDENLPSPFTLSPSNYFKHKNHRASSVYVLLHMLRSLCRIILHREYIPFIPTCCQGPEGPTDHPPFPKEECPNGWWRESAENVFKHARDIVDLIELYQHKDELPKCNIVLFAIWTASSIGLYAYHFPKMDTERYMLSEQHGNYSQETAKDGALHHGPTALTYNALKKTSAWLSVADVYVKIFGRMDMYFDHAKKDFYKTAERNETLCVKAKEALTNSFTAINRDSIRQPQPDPNHRTPFHLPATPDSHSDSYTNSEPTTVAHQVLDQEAPRGLFEERQKQETWQWNTRDIRLFATGESQDFDELFAGRPDILPPNEF